MTGRLADVEARIGTVQKLGAVIRAMRGIATARVQEAHEQVEAIRAYAETIGDAIAEAMALMPDPAPTGISRDDRHHAVIVITAEQGFAGTYNEQVFDAATPLLDGPHDLFLVGDRGVLVATERHRNPVWNDAMIVHPAQAVSLVTRMTDALFRMMDTEEIARVSVVHAMPTGVSGMEVVTRQLVPFDYARFPLPGRRSAPMTTLPPARLLAQLVDEYIVAELVEAVMLAFAAENVARMRAMIAAQDNVKDTTDTLVATSRRLRQEEITEEIVELAAGHSHR
ncbi:F0F1 ATP synthase subunit gamma [Chachezhania sediminis]|uniref:F0F1 ATP synthase subunit gamma n=1 Tax=Chachezhania sediminis TaxID=2599291 RepID=UPI00131CAEBE|nr:FoF1 ATP synthase subunit gamma [Chachezhania sediminis]